MRTIAARPWEKKQLSPLDKKLREVGYHGNCERVEQVIAEQFDAYRNGGTDEDLLCDPWQTLEFNEAVRKILGPAAECIPNKLINKTLLNLRKASRILLD